MRRREFIAGLVLPLAWPAWGQPARTYKLAVLSLSAKIADIGENGDNPHWAAFFRELRALGYIEGRNLVVVRRSAETDLARLPELSKEVVDLQPDVIVTGHNRLRWLKEGTSSIPIVAAG